MSRFSGKFDLYDEIEIYGGFEKWKSIMSHLYVGNKEISFQNLSDVAPYFAHIPVSSFHSNEGGSIVYLTEESWIDRKEKSFKVAGFSTEYWEYCREKLKQEIEKINKGEITDVR